MDGEEENLFSPSGIENTLSEFRRTAQQLDGLLTNFENETSRMEDVSRLNASEMDSDMSDDEIGEAELRDELNAVSLPNSPASAVDPDAMGAISPIQQVSSPLDDSAPSTALSPQNNEPTGLSPIRPMRMTPVEHGSPQFPISARTLAAGSIGRGDTRITVSALTDSEIGNGNSGDEIANDIQVERGDVQAEGGIVYLEEADIEALPPRIKEIRPGVMLKQILCALVGFAVLAGLVVVIFVVGDSDANNDRSPDSLDTMGTILPSPQPSELPTALDSSSFAPTRSPVAVPSLSPKPSLGTTTGSPTFGTLPPTLGVIWFTKAPSTLSGDTSPPTNSSGGGDDDDDNDNVDDDQGGDAGPGDGDDNQDDDASLPGSGSGGDNGESDGEIDLEEEVAPTVMPSRTPTARPTVSPSHKPSRKPTMRPSFAPSEKPLPFDKPREKLPKKASSRRLQRRR